MIPESFSVEMVDVSVCLAKQWRASSCVMNYDLRPSPHMDLDESIVAYFLTVIRYKKNDNKSFFKYLCFREIKRVISSEKNDQNDIQIFFLPNR